MTNVVQILTGDSSADRIDQAVALYDKAFGSKFALAIPSSLERRRLFKSTFDLGRAFVAVHRDEIVGIVGFHHGATSLTSGITYRELIRHLGLWSGYRAALVFSLYERKPVDGELLLDGIAVAETHRGQGIGSRLLREVAEYAAREGFTSIRLDVVDTNGRARKLYDRCDFQPTHTESFEWLRWLFGFGSVTTMVRNV